MVDYIYDGTFEGLLTCIYKHYYEEKASEISKKGEYQAGLFNNCIEVDTDEEKSDKVYNAIYNKISPYDLGRVYKVFKSQVNEKEMKILNYIKLGFKLGRSISKYHGNSIVFEVQTAEKKVNNEIHRLYGLIRFTVLGNRVLYSPIEPNNDVVEFLSEHFCDRYRNEPFIIHDLRRSKALVYGNNQWYVTKFQSGQLPPMNEDEKLYQILWKNYFDTIAIKDRINPRCQKNFMPVRYWKHLTEKQV